MAIPVKLQIFEGPLDLLLHLIEKNKVDIYDIPIVEITAQYLDYIKAMETEDMNVMSEFLVMAATLLEIKCRMLLPREVDEEGEEIDPRAELVQKLLEYKMYKYMSYELKDRQVDAARTLFREKNLPKEVAESSFGRRGSGKASVPFQDGNEKTGGQDRSGQKQLRKYREG